MAIYGDFVTGETVSFQHMRYLLEQQGGLQEGVVNVGDFKVAQRGAGANMSVDVAAGGAWVKIDSGTRNGLAHVVNDATANVTVTAANGTNPRIDQIVLQYNDTAIPAGVSGDTPTLRVITGTATAGATLDNRNGAASLPNDALRLSDVLVPAASSSVTDANIRDRRPWARGYMDYYPNALTGPIIIPVDSTVDRVFDIEYSLNQSTWDRVLLRPNGLTTSIYSYVSQGLVLVNTNTRSDSSAHAHNNNDGIYLGKQPAGSTAGAVNSVGRARFMLSGSAGSGRPCKVEAVVQSAIGSGNQVAEVFDVAQSWNDTTTVIHSMHLAYTGNITGHVRARRF